MKFRILHVITTIDLGGAEKQLLTLATSQRAAGHEVEILFLKENPKLFPEFLEADVKVRPELAKFSFAKQVLSLKKLDVSPEVIVHAHLPRAELLCALALKSKSFLITRHNSEAFFPGMPKFCSRILSHLVLRKAFASISISHAVREFLKSTGELLDEDNNFVIHYGLSDTTVSDKNNPEADSGIFRIGTVSRLVPQKNIALLLRAFGELNSHSSQTFELSVAGVGPLLEELRTLALQLEIGDLVSWHGQRKDLTQFYRSLDLFVLPSNYEGFGLVLLEAMSNGIPVVARNISAISEVLGKNHPGLVNSNDATHLSKRMDDMLFDKALQRHCLEYQTQRLQDFSIKKTRTLHDDLYRKFLFKKGFST